MNPLNTQQRRSLMSFIVIAFFAVGAAVFLIGKGSEAANEIDLLNNEYFVSHRALLNNALDERDGLKASTTPEKQPL